MPWFIKAYGSIDFRLTVQKILIVLADMVHAPANLHSSFRLYTSIRPGGYVVAPPAVHENKLVQGFEGLRGTVAEIVARILDETSKIGLEKKFSEDVSTGIEALIGLTAVGDRYRKACTAERNTAVCQTDRDTAGSKRRC